MTGNQGRYCRHSADKNLGLKTDFPSSGGGGAIRVEKLTIAFGGRQALNDVTVSIPNGRLTSILGPPGSGKTVLLRSLSCELPWGAGTVWIQDVPAQLWPPKKREACLRTCPMARALSCLGADSAVCGLARSNDSDGDLISAESLDRSLRLLGVEHLKGRCGATLSDRDRRRIALAETLAPFQMPADTASLHLWLDDPLDGIDSLHQHQLLRWLQETAGSRHTTIVTASDHGLIHSYADHVILLAGGRVVAEGSPYTALRSHHLTKAFGTQHYGETSVIAKQ